MAEGNKWDKGKPDWTYLPSAAIEDVLKVYAGGAAKYGRGNYLHGIKYSRVFSAALRHLWAWWRGEDIDEESGLSHLAHAAWNVITLLEYVKRGTQAKFDDRTTVNAPPEVSIPSVWTAPDPNLEVKYTVTSTPQPEGSEYVILQQEERGSDGTAKEGASEGSRWKNS